MVCDDVSDIPIYDCGFTLRVLLFIGRYINSFRREALDHVAAIEQLALAGNGLPYRIPRRYISYVEAFAPSH